MLGEVAAQEELHPKEQPREPKEKRMQSACRDAWPSLGTKPIDVPLAGMHAPCMAKRPYVVPCMSKDSETQHVEINTAPHTAPTSSRQTPPYDSLIGPTFFHSHPDGSRLEAITHSQNSPHTPANPTMNNQAPPSQAHELMMANLEQVWSSLSLEHSQDELVSFVRISVHPRTAMVWNQVSQTPSLPLRVETPPQPTTHNRSRSNAWVQRPGHPYQTPTRSSRAPPVRQRTISMSSSSAESPDPLPAAIFRFLD